MGDRIASDHSSVKAVRSTMYRDGDRRQTRGAGRRGAVRFRPTSCRVALDGEELFARVERALTGDDLLIRASTRRRTGRDPSGATDRLSGGPPKTIFRRGLGAGRRRRIRVSLRPSRTRRETTYYDAREPPSDSLSEIAKDLESH